MGYRILSKYRTELMGVAILWVMLFHSFDLDMGHPLLEWFRRLWRGGHFYSAVLHGAGDVPVQAGAELLPIHGPAGGPDTSGLLSGDDPLYSVCPAHPGRALERPDLERRPAVLLGPPPGGF